MSSAARRALRLACALAAVLLVVALVLDKVAPGPSGPTGSSYATAPTGLSAFADLLARSAHPVKRVRDVPSHAGLDPADTVIVLDPTQLLAPDAAALRRFVYAGGRLVVGGQDPQAWVSELIADPPTWTSTGPQHATPLIPTPDTSGVTEVRSAGTGSWTQPRGTLPVLGAPGSSLLTVADLGAGQIALLADSSPLQNRLLDHADNAAFGLALAGPAGRPVSFEEAVHGYGAANGLASLPERWKWALIGLLLASLVAVAARIRRLAAPDPPPPPALPPRGEHVEALALALARTHQPWAATAPVRERARARLLERAGLDSDAGAEQVATAAAGLGLDSAEARALAKSEPEPEPETEPDDDGVLAAGRALAKLSPGS